MIVDITLPNFVLKRMSSRDCPGLVSGSRDMLCEVDEVGLFRKAGL